MMFYDERINAECGKIYRRGIAYATGMTLIYTILRGLYLFSIHQLKAVYLITELAILLCGAVILITGAIRFAGERDERTAWEKHNYYLKAGKIFLIVTLSGFAASLPFASEKRFSDFPTNHLILVLEVLAVLYLFYSFKARDINFNYTFIAEDNRTYYLKVLSNVGLFAGILFLAYAAAASLDFLMHQSLLSCLGIMLSYLGSAVGVGAEYFFLSWLEKLSYNHEPTTGLRRSTVTAAIFSMAFTALDGIIKAFYYGIATGAIPHSLFFGADPSTLSFGEFLAKISYVRLYLGYYVTVMSAVALCHFLSQVRRSDGARRGIRGMLIASALSLVFSTVNALIFPLLSDLFLRDYAHVINGISQIFPAVRLLFAFLATGAIVRAFKVHGAVWIIPIAEGVFFLLSTAASHMSSFLLMVFTLGEVLILPALGILGLVLLHKCNYTEIE